MKKGAYQHLFTILIALTLLSCGGSQGQFRLKGNFAHLEQGEFLFYSSDGGLDIVDTLHIQGGAFEYTAKLADKATYRILYPNFSELVIFGHSGGVVKIKGDAQNLNAVAVSGDEDNETFTQFRQEIANQSDKQVLELAKQYILEKPTLYVSQYLFRKYLLQNPQADRKLTQEVYDSLCRALPEDVALSRLSDKVKSKDMLKAGSPMPDFKLANRNAARIDTTSTAQAIPKGKKAQKKAATPDSLKINRKKEITLKDYQGKHLLIVFWSDWKSGSQSALYYARKMRRESHGRIDAISYSLSTDEATLRQTEERDSITFPSYCDFRTWDSPLIRRFGIRDLPYYILVDDKGKIVTCGTDWAKEIEPKTKDLCS